MIVTSGAYLDGLRAVAGAIRPGHHSALSPINRIAPPVQGARPEPPEGRATAAGRLGAERC